MKASEQTGGGSWILLLHTPGGSTLQWGGERGLRRLASLVFFCLVPCVYSRLSFWADVRFIASYRVHHPCLMLWLITHSRMPVGVGDGRVGCCEPDSSSLDVCVTAERCIAGAELRDPAASSSTFRNTDAIRSARIAPRPAKHEE